MGPSGQQRSLAAMAQEQARKASSLQGLTQQQAQRMFEMGTMQSRQLMQTINAVQFQQMSALEKEVLAEGVVNRALQQQQRVMRAVSDADIEATSRNLIAAQRATQAAAQQATQIRQMEIQQEQRQRALRQQAEQNFIKAVGQTTQAAVSLAGKMKPEEETTVGVDEEVVAREAAKINEPQNITTGGLRGAMGASFERTQARRELLRQQQPDVSINFLFPELEEVDSFYDDSGFNLSEVG